MKIVALTALALMATSSNAFVVQPASAGRTVMALRADASSLIQEALALSKKHGASSVEARLAWEAVEEVSSADNSEATKGTLEECEIDEEKISAACLEYSTKMEQLQEMIQAQQPALAALKTMAEEVQQVKLAVPEVVGSSGSTDADSSDELKEALAEAQRLTKEKGVTSSEAKLAWETVEELAAAGNANALGGSMSIDECLVDTALEACNAMEELSRVLESQAN